jgi:FixJ family two-component response regulator
MACGELGLRIHLIDNDETYIALVQAMFADTSRFKLACSLSISELSDLSFLSEIDLILLDVLRPDSLGLRVDVEHIRVVTNAPIIFITGSDTSIIRDDAILYGAEAVIDKEGLNEEVIVQLALNAVSRRKSEHAREEILETKRGSLKNIAALGASMSYIEAGLSTLLDVMSDSGKQSSKEFVEHLRETMLAIKQYSEDDLRSQDNSRLDTFIDQSWSRIQHLAETRKIALGLDWEQAVFKQIGSNQLIRLGVQHLLEGVVRSAFAEDAIWVQAERAEEQGAGVIRIHMSRPLLPKADCLFPEIADKSSYSEILGLDAISSLHLGALLLFLAPEQVSLQTESKQQLLNIYL